MNLGGGFREKLRNELGRRTEEGSLPELMLALLAGGRRGDAAGLEGLSLGAGHGFRGDLALETVVNAFDSPSLLIRGHSYAVPASSTWAAVLEPHRAVLEAMIPAVGRIEVDNHPTRSWIGTGVLVAPDVVVTNRHVARDMTVQSAQGWVFAPGVAGQPVRPRIDFREEHGVVARAEFVLVDVLAVENALGPDLAFLRVENHADLPRPVDLTVDVLQVDDAVAAIGYTSRVFGMPPEVETILEAIFGGVFDVKRLAPGRILEVAAGFLAHDCSTQGGNSGSALVDIETGRVAGIHFEGGISENLAVSAAEVQARLDALS